MKPKKNSYPAVNIGSSFMLVILIILSMVIFAVLSLSGALRDARYIEKKADRTGNYYQANNLAEEKLKEIDQILSKTAETEDFYTAGYQEKAISELTKLGNITVSAADESDVLILIHYSIPMGETDSLEVTLAANDRQAKSDGYYYITEWKQVSTQEWNGNSTLPVIKGD